MDPFSLKRNRNFRALIHSRYLKFAIKIASARSSSACAFNPDSTSLLVKMSFVFFFFMRNKNVGHYTFFASNGNSEKNPGLI